MSAKHPESTLITRLQMEITAMNREFLGLVSSSTPLGLPSVLGLDAGVISALQSMNADQLQRLASSPVLLVGFASLNPEHPQLQPNNRYQVAESHVSAEWLDSVSAYANRLLATFWHYSRQLNELAGFCLGLDAQEMRALAGLSFFELGDRSPAICSSLNARLADHPGCWNDMVRMAGNNDDKLSIAQLSLIPLSLAACAHP